MAAKLGEPLRLELSEAHARWLEDERKISSEMAAELGIVSHGDRLVFQYHRKDALLWLQYRIAKRRADGSLDKTFACYAPDGKTTLSEAGIELCLWNEDDLTDPSLPDAPRIITEGQFDAVSFKEAGATHVGSVPNGAVERMGEGAIDPYNDRQFQYLWRDGQLIPGLATAKMIILATDDDKAGRVLRDELAIRIGRSRCWYVTYPKDVIPALGRPCKDANEVHVHLGIDAVMELVANAKPIVPSRLVKMSEVPDGEPEAFNCGWPGLKDNLRIIRPELMVITGPPGHGKSQFALSLGANLASEHGWPGAIIQFEDMIARYRKELTNYWIGRNDGGDPREASEETNGKAAKWIDRMFRIVAPSEEVEDESMDLAWLRRMIEEAATRHGCRWVLIDPWNEIEHMFPKGQTEVQYYNTALAGLKRLARSYQILLMIIAHPDKSGGQETEIDNWTLYHMAGGAVWNNKADHGIVVYRPDLTDVGCYVKIAKSRLHWLMGRPGIVEMRYRPLLGTYQFTRQLKQLKKSS